MIIYQRELIDSFFVLICNLSLFDYWFLFTRCISASEKKNVGCKRGASIYKVMVRSGAIIG